MHTSAHNRSLSDFNESPLDVSTALILCLCDFLEEKRNIPNGLISNHWLDYPFKI